MGYSCAAKASYTLDAIAELLAAETSNGMPDGGFWERGRENADGAITGTVWKPYDEARVTRRGSFRIEPDGMVARFPGLPRGIKTQAEEIGASKFNANHEADRNWRLDALRLADFLQAEKAFASECWPELEAIARDYQRETKAMFLAMPAVEPEAMADWLTDLVRTH